MPSPLLKAPRPGRAAAPAAPRRSLRPPACDCGDGRALRDLQEVERQLAAIGRSADAAAHAVISAAEALRPALARLPARERAAALAQVVRLLELAGFGDLVGQRVARAEAAVDRAAAASGRRNGRRLAADGSGANPPVNGPQAPGDGLDQQAVDAFFA